MNGVKENASFGDLELVATVLGSLEGFFFVPIA